MISISNIFHEYKHLLPIQSQNKYLFEVSKCCGWGYFQTFYKSYTLEDLYRNILLETGFENIICLYLLNNNEKIAIPRDANIKLCDYINNNTFLFIPIYPLPSKVVYRIYIDDGHNHSMCT